MVTVTCRNYPVGRVTLTCRAFNLYTREATLVWLQDGKPVQQKTFRSETILPSGDGTYQARVSIRVLPGQEPQFSCNLRHGNHSIMQTAVSGHAAEDSQDVASSATASAGSALPVVLAVALARAN